MAKEPETPVADLWVGNQSAMFYLGGREIFVHPGTIVRTGNPVRQARPSLFEPLIIQVAHEEGLPVSQGATVLVCGDSEGAGFGAEHVSVKRFRTKPADGFLSS